MAHPPDIKARAKAIYEQDGAMAAAEQLGISVRTIREWAKAERWTRNLPSAAEVQAAYDDQRREQSQRITAGWQQRKRRLGDEAGEAAAEVLGQLRVRVAKGTVYGVEQLARAFDFLTRRADEMTAGVGGEGSRGMPREERMGRVVEIAKTLRERAAAAGGNGEGR